MTALLIVIHCIYSSATGEAVVACLATDTWQGLSSRCSPVVASNHHHSGYDCKSSLETVRGRWLVVPSLHLSNTFSCLPCVTGWHTMHPLQDYFVQGSDIAVQSCLGVFVGRGKYCSCSIPLLALARSLEAVTATVASDVYTHSSEACINAYTCTAACIGM